MILVSVKISRKNSRLLWLKFLEGRLLLLSADDFVSLGLHRLQDIDPSLFARLEKLSAVFLLREYSLRQIAISPKIRSILHPKLVVYSHRLCQKFNYPADIFPELINLALNRLFEENLLNESAYIDYFVHRYSRKSTAEINFRLRRLGLNPPQIDSTSDRPKIKDLIQKRYSRLNLLDHSDKNKVISSLARKGFAINDIKTAIDEVTGKLVEYKDFT